ncbi:hypothetical protein PH7735_02555 [Shimia thalassica]|uniref:Uncharacterized protein n=1 Tax=Shimia thalassica TaxID=1715693 RepID=A0A0P1IAU1_9RHOB|nr:hypothetical protein PH7735_02555 [Shimia thalassica]
MAIGGNLPVCGVKTRADTQNYGGVTNRCFEILQLKNFAIR